MNKERLDRGLRPGWKPRQGGVGGPARQDLDKFGCRAKCFRCKKVGHFSGDCKEPHPAHSTNMVIAELVDTSGGEVLVQAVQEIDGPEEKVQCNVDVEINSNLKAHEDNALAKLI